MADVEYRGYLITIRKADGLWANIRPKGSGLLLSEIPQATRDEGEAILLARAKACIDADIVAVEDALSKARTE